MKWIYQMDRVRVARGEKVILDDVTLTFLPGAKIGVVGPNGAGKSTVLRLMAGLDRPSNGDAVPAAGIRIGILLQEPPLDESTTVLGNVDDGVGDTRALLARFTQLTQALAEGYSAELLAEMGSLQEQLDHRDAWDLDAQLEQAMDALRCPPPRRPGRRAVGRRTTPGRAVQAAAATPGPALAGRADQPPRCRKRAVAGAASERLSGHGRRGHP